MIPWLDNGAEFPPVELALREPNGLLAAGGDLSLARLTKAYREGIFPWFSTGDPILWWSPDPRMVLVPNELRVSRSMRKSLRRHDYEVRCDTAFASVVRACAEPRADQNGTWITRAIMAAYERMHRAGLAHSVETWVDGKLVGGLYGVAIGRMFYGESMFARATDASKIAFVHLVRQLKRWDFGPIDCQMKTTHLQSLGAREMARSDFICMLRELVNYPATNSPWQFDDDLVE